MKTTILATLVMVATAQGQTPVPIPTPTASQTPAPRLVLQWVCPQGGLLVDQTCWSTLGGEPGNAGIPNSDVDCTISGPGAINGSIADDFACHNVHIRDFTGSLSLPRNGFKVYGEPTLGSGFIIDGEGIMDLVGSGAITANGYNELGGTIQINGAYYQSDDWIGPLAKVKLRGGTYDMNSRLFVLNSIKDGGRDGNATLIMRNSIIYCANFWFGDGGDIETQPGNSVLIACPGPHGHPLYDLIVPEMNCILGNPQFTNSITLSPGAHVGSNPGFTADPNLPMGYYTQRVVCNGTAEKPITLIGNPEAVWNAVEQIHCTHTTVIDVNCTGTGPCMADKGSVRGPGNDGWCFPELEPCSSITYTPTITPPPTVTPTMTLPPEPGCYAIQNAWMQVSCVDGRMLGKEGGNITQAEPFIREVLKSCSTNPVEQCETNEDCGPNGICRDPVIVGFSSSQYCGTNVEGAPDPFSVCVLELPSPSPSSTQTSTMLPTNTPTPSVTPTPTGCPLQPIEGCRQAESGKLKIMSRRNRVSLSLQTTIGMVTSFQVCGYDLQNGNPEVAFDILGAAGTGWKSLTRRTVYHTGTSEGQRIRARFNARGVHVASSGGSGTPLPFFADPGLLVQITDQGNQCQELLLLPIRNTAKCFRGKQR